MTEVSAPLPIPAGSSFYQAMRILPKPQRESMYQVYAFCRAVDDIADEGGARANRIAALQTWRADIERLYSGGGTSELTRGIAGPVKEFALRKADFLAVIDGMEMDAREDIRAPDWAALDLYCDRVASAVGRLSNRIFGLEDQPGQALAHHLGRALQLTNILRDIDEDAGIGRLYLPREALQKAGVAFGDLQEAIADPKLPEACLDVAARVREHFKEADKIMNSLPRAAVKSPRIMGTVYKGIFDRLTARGFAPPRQRTRTPKSRVLMAVLRYGIF